MIYVIAYIFVAVAVIGAIAVGLSVASLRYDIELPQLPQRKPRPRRRHKPATKTGTEKKNVR